MPTIQPTAPSTPLQRGFADLTEPPRRPPEPSRFPLKSERMRIVVRGPLALVSREQVFRNEEDRTIEATVTFPVPVHATLHSLSARIGERTLVAKALQRDAARATYEKAIEDGKTAVLHEEAVRGVHVLSIAHIPTGATIAVTHYWIIALAPRGDDKWHVRIPVTVGDIYGVSPFNDADDLATSPQVVHNANVEVDCGDAVASISGTPVTAGRRLDVVLDAPIELEIAGLTTLSADGVAADGRRVRVSLTLDIGGDAAIDAAILIDRSGSMGDALSSELSTPTKHVAVVAGLTQAAGALRPRDRAELWEFDNSTERVGGRDTSLVEAIGELGEPRGGTEIGSALNTVVSGSSAGDIILVTDGLSHALDVQALANSGRRFTVVLVGEDSFEANVGRLAAMTGGQIFLVGRTSDAAFAVRAAIGSVRRTKAPFRTATWPLAKATGQFSGAVVVATWDAKTGDVDAAFAKGIGALAAALALPSLSAEQAGKVAADHGIVSHLTSLVLVDDAGEEQTDLPAQRKVPLMAARFAAPRCAAMAAPAQAPRSRSAALRVDSPARPPSPVTDDTGSLAEDAIAGLVQSLGGNEVVGLTDLARRIDWGANPEALRQGDLTGLASELVQRILAAAKTPEVGSLAGAGGNPVAIVVALLAKSRGLWNRSAARVAKAVLAGLDRNAVAKAMAALGL